MSNKPLESASPNRKNSSKKKKNSVANSPVPQAKGAAATKNTTNKRVHKSSKSENVKKSSKKKLSMNEFTPIDSIESLQSTSAAPNRERNASRKNSKKKSVGSASPRAPKQQQQQQHSRYSTANGAPAKKRKTRPQNKIKAKNKAAHNKAATTQNALQQQSDNQFNNNKANNHRHQATLPNPLRHQQQSPKPQQRTRGQSYGRQHAPRGSQASSARHNRFDVTEMQLVIGQIADMKKSWKTPAEKVMGRIYQIIDVEERPHLNGKYCKVMLVLDDENYRAILLNNSSEHVVTKHNLSVAFETENLYLLWESQQKSLARKRSTLGRQKRSTIGDQDHGHTALDMEQAGAGKPAPPQSRPPQQQQHYADDMCTVKAFETSFKGTYEFKRYDFYCMTLCIVFGVILGCVGVYFYVAVDNLYAIGAFSIIFAPVLALMIGVYIGCVWYCCAVRRGQMDYYLGENRFFGLRCRRCDCCKFQYFVVVSLIGLFIVAVAVASYMLFDKYVIQHSDEINMMPSSNSLDVNLENEQNAFLVLEILACIGGVGLFVSGIAIYCCCLARAMKMRQKSSADPDDDFNDNDTIANFEE